MFALEDDVLIDLVADDVNAMPFGEIRKTLLAASGRRAASGRWVPLIRHVGVWGLGCGYDLVAEQVEFSPLPESN